MYRWLEDSSIDHHQVARWLLSGLAVVGTCKALAGAYRSRKRRQKIQKKRDIVEDKKKKIMQKLIGLKKPLENMNTITSYNVPTLTKKLESGELQIIDVLEAFQAKALTVDRQTNCITEPIYDADVTAIFLDSSQGKKGPLHGIPVSVKDMLPIAGYDNTYGLSARLFRHSESDCVIVKVLRSQGAIPFAITNMCQTGMAIDCPNPVYGETVNPHNNERTCGGSSGGEGALVGGGGSPLGIGTDIGGSIRIPSSHCGICGFKPTTGRLSMAGVQLPSPQQCIIEVAVGPMSCDVAGVVQAMRGLLCDEMYRLDAQIPVCPFKEDVFGAPGRMKIGYYTRLGGLAIEPVPAVKRAVMEAKEALEAMGHELIEFSPPKSDEGTLNLFLTTMSCDGGHSLRTDLKAEEVTPGLRFTYLLFCLPRPLKRLLRWVLSWVHPLFSMGIRATEGLPNIPKLWQHVEDLEEYRTMFHAAWSEAELDAVIGPVQPFPAPPIGETKYLIPAIMYTSLYNLLDYPAGVVPVTKVTKDDLESWADDYPKDLLHKRVRKNQEDSTGLPIGVQVVGMKWRDEVSLRTMRDLEEGLTKVKH